MTGFIKMPRGWMDYPALKTTDRFTRREAFAWLVEQAAYRERKLDLEGQTVILSRGSLAHPGRYMAQAWGWTEPRVRGLLKRLESDRHISTEIVADRRIVTICDYDRIQQAVEENDAEATRHRRVGGAREKKERTGKKKKITNRKIQKASPSARAARARTAPTGDSRPALVADVHASAARERLWRDGPAIVMQLTGLSKTKAHTLLERLVSETRDDCVLVMVILGRAQERHPLADAQAFLMAAARNGGGVAADGRPKPEPRFGARWLADILRPTGEGAAPAYDLDLQAEAVDE